ncbi:abc exporter atp-binding family [Leptolyngbya sp. Heron Island J]|uniref:ATP-binding cassette domain-containing protein n=1 Tax=Leptolyngbya sp. Heron Island J TaxID=1385935 RepID=UPI0003B9625A|nr:ATP-binding cassette domain-containing protein [Leptolyngbya sp. Heron Island J]ESA37779.1 abc exporter atp-binding family [Leptolyngbya sp. Heron Island J]
MTPVISIRQLNHAFGNGALSKPVLNNIDLDIHAGEIVLLMGPSGSGKTTLLTLIGGLRSLQSGHLTVLDQTLHNSSTAALRQVRSQIGFIFQAHNLLRCLTAWENVSMPLKLHHHLSSQKRKQRSHAILDQVGMGSRADYYPDSLSGGQKQRVAISRALVNHPKLILADEPTAALDGKSGQEVMTLLQYLAKQQGSTILIVTHDNRILDVADRIITMEDGYLK